MSTRGVLMMQGKRYYIRSDAYPDFALSRIQRLATSKKPLFRSANRMAYKNWLSPMGAKEKVGYPFEEFRYVADKRTGKVSYLDVFAHARKHYPHPPDMMTPPALEKKIDRSVENWGRRQLAKQEVKPMGRRKYYGRTVHRAYHQTGKSNVAYDRRHRARYPGKRVSKTGHTYYEYRKNRSDMNPYGRLFK